MYFCLSRATSQLATHLPVIMLNSESRWWPTVVMIANKEFYLKDYYVAPLLVVLIARGGSIVQNISPKPRRRSLSDDANVPLTDV